MLSSLQVFIATAILLTSTALAQSDPQLVGTWTTKSKKVITGPGFYNPVDDKFIEPELTGISYSFTEDGWFEEAYYRAIANPARPSCPSAIMQWQHGRYKLSTNGSITFTPIAVDGRQQTSSPCAFDTSLYVRYHQSEFMQKYAVYKDPFHGVMRLDLYQFDGSPMHPMFLEYKPPMMLPTQTLNPTSTASSTATATAAPQMRKRGFGGHLEDEDHHLQAKLPSEDDENHGRYVWWFGIGSILLGTVMYMIPTSTSA